MDVLDGVDGHSKRRGFPMIRRVIAEDIAC